jgi:hypothetical protein
VLDCQQSTESHQSLIDGFLSGDTLTNTSNLIIFMKKPKTRSRTSIIPEGYEEFLRGLKERVRQAQLSAVLAVIRQTIENGWPGGSD